MPARTATAHLRKRYRKVAGKDGKSDRKALIGFYIEFYDRDRHPKRKWIPLGTKDKTAAMAKFAAMEQDYARGDFDPWTDKAKQTGVRLADAKERYLASRQKRPASLRNDRSVLEALEGTLPLGTLIGHVRREDVTRFLSGLDVADSSRRTYHARLRAFFAWAEAEGLIAGNPLYGVVAPKVGRKTPTYLSRDEVDALVSAARAEMPWLSDIIVFAVGTGFRLAEICNLRWDSVSLTDAIVTVANYGEFRSKSGHERAVPVGGDALAVLERRETDATGPYVFTGRRGGKANETYVSKRFKDLVRSLGLSEDVTFHTLRHTYASWLVAGGVPIYDVKELMGHASIEMTMRYAHLAPDRLRAGVAKVFGN